METINDKKYVEMIQREMKIFFQINTKEQTNLQNLWDMAKAYIRGQKVAIFKEIPQHVMKKRKDYFVIAQELRKQKIQFCWELPVGLSFMFNGQRVKINTVESATDFLQNTLGVSVTLKEVVRGEGGKG